MNETTGYSTAMALGQTDLDGWMNAECSIMGTHKVRAPWWIKEEAKIDGQGKD